MQEEQIRYDWLVLLIRLQTAHERQEVVQTGGGHESGTHHSIQQTNDIFHNILNIISDTKHIEFVRGASGTEAVNEAKQQNFHTVGPRSRVIVHIMLKANHGSPTPCCVSSDSPMDTNRRGGAHSSVIDKGNNIASVPSSRICHLPEHLLHSPETHRNSAFLRRSGCYTCLARNAGTAAKMKLRNGKTYNKIVL